ncbi:MAG: hemagglutinin repeat-containing protein, partial [Rhodanobacter sp.]|nr:hemagglutinin repeat-containing protein [Rhodanobacter sp.]
MCGDSLVIREGRTAVTTTTRDETLQTWSVGSTLSGDTVTVAAGHDLGGTAVQIAGTHDVVLAAGHDLVLRAGQDTYRESDGTRVSRTGLMNGGGFSVLIGNRTTQAGNTVDDVSYTGSLVGSTDGAVTLTAGHDVHLTGSDVLSQTATTIVGQHVTLDAAVGRTDTTQTQRVHTGGITVGLSGGVVGMVQSVYGAAQAHAHGSQDSRVLALHDMAVASHVALHANEVANSVQDMSNGGTGGINLQLGIGGSTASNRAEAHDETAYGSLIQSKGNVSIAATGGDLDIVGSDVFGANIALAARHDVNVLSQVEHHTLMNTSKNASGGVGLQIGTDGIGFYAQASVGKGKAHGNGTTHVES